MLGGLDTAAHPSQRLLHVDLRRHASLAEFSLSDFASVAMQCMRACLSLVCSSTQGWHDQAQVKICMYLITYFFQYPTYRTPTACRKPDWLDMCVTPVCRSICREPMMKPLNGCVPQLAVFGSNWQYLDSWLEAASLYAACPSLSCLSAWTV